MAEKDLLEDAKTLCTEFLSGDWRNIENIETSKLTGGFVNVLVLCSLKASMNTNTTTATSPEKVNSS